MAQPNSKVKTVFLADADPKREPHPGPAEQLARRLDLLRGEGVSLVRCWR